jgi:hypothetical protein
MKTTTTEGEQLRRAISRREFPTSQLSAELRAGAISYARRRAAEDAPQSVIAEELGVSIMSVGRWLRARESAALVPVRIIADPAGGSSGLEVVTPRGLRVVGLEMDTLCALLERHG